MSNDAAPRVALITGGARRIGAAITRELHTAGCHVIVHYHRSGDAAEALQKQLNTIRPDSCTILQANLGDMPLLRKLANEVIASHGRIDLLVNNAAGFFSTPLERATEQQWEALFGANVKAAYFLAQALAPALATAHGAIVNIVDIHASLPLRNYSIYCMSKAALAMATRSLAVELGPAVRVNAVAPGAILWPEDPAQPLTPERARELLGPTALGGMGSPAAVASAVRYLGLEATHITGQILAVDGGRTLY